VTGAVQTSLFHRTDTDRETESGGDDDGGGGASVIITACRLDSHAAGVPVVHLSRRELTALTDCAELTTSLLNTPSGAATYTQSLCCLQRLAASSPTRRQLYMT